MKKFSLLFVAFTFLLLSQRISLNDAYSIGFYFGKEKLQRQVIFDSLHIKTYVFENDTVLYILYLEPEGFVVVPAWIVSVPVLAYSNKGKLVSQEPHQAFSLWLNSYARQVKHAIQNKITPSEKSIKLYQDYLKGHIPKLKSQVGPLLHTTWDQGTYYNMYCPIDPAGPDNRCVTGCVATAIGQLFNYFRWPVRGTGAYTSEDTTYGVLFVDFSQHTYQYNEMPTFLSRENKEVAKLLYHIGVSVDMHYGPHGSGMTNHKAAYIMREFFSYNSQTQYLFRDTFQGNWINVILDHLNQKLPLYYAGWSDTTYTSGHAFVVDGYQDSTYFHINWGWGGLFDGYFYLDQLTPGGANFNLSQEVIVNMIPVGNYPPYCQGIDTLKSVTGTIDDGSGPLYPYKSHTHCSWLILPEDSVTGFHLDFIEFNVDSGGVLKIFAGDNPSAPLVGAFTGHFNSFHLHVPNTSRLLLTFTSSNDSSDGFLIEYRATTLSYCSGIVTLNQPTDTFSDGSGSYPYQGNTLCRWKIQTYQPTWLKFLTFEVDPTDYVRIFDNSSGHLVDLSGFSLPDPIFSLSGDLSVIFKTSPTYRANGFVAYYHPSAAYIKDLPQELFAYPNPVQDKLFLTGIEEKTHVRIFSIDSKLVSEHLISKENPVIYVHDLREGVYIVNLRFRNENQNFFIIKK
ncbi:MAG: C10 family peptidase [Bacteroidales bacterium]|nr:C10 family peptidase [Bacteroidales bacterium]